MSDPGRPGRPPRTWPDRIPADPELAERLNREWQITLSVPAQPSLKQRLARPLRQALGVLFRPQETFNSAVVQQLNRQIAAILQLTDTRKRLAALGFDPIDNTPDQFTAYIKVEVAKWAKVIRESGARVD